jgi:hypothetical protein
VLNKFKVIELLLSRMKVSSVVGRGKYDNLLKGSVNLTTVV